jgi:hypothetical protein
MLRASREETLPRTNKSIKTVELSQHNCDVRVHSLPSHEAGRPLRLLKADLCTWRVDMALESFIAV